MTMVNNYVGELTDYARENWKTMEEPFNVLQTEHKEQLWGVDWIEFRGWADVHFKEEVQVDWGSFAWKCDKKGIIEMYEHFGLEIPEFIEQLDPDKEYGAVMIEMY